MSTIVLVHGAMQTAATWDRVAPLLRGPGHTVHTPQLTGLGPGSGPITAAVNLDTHIADVVAFITQHDLEPVVLVGHSYAGMVVTGAAARLGARVEQLVYLDAFAPERDQAAFDFMPDSIRRKFQARVAADGFTITADEHMLDLWHLEGEARTFARARLWDFSMNCFKQPLRDDARLITANRTYVACVGPGNTAQQVFASIAQRARRELWPCHELVTGHECQITEPVATANIVLAACRGAVVAS